jgi:hypothetical protein
MKIFNLRKVKERSGIYWKNDWLEFHPEFRMANFRVEKTGYYDARPQVNFTLTTLLGIIGLVISPFVGIWFALAMLSVILFIPWGQVYLKIPYNTGMDEDSDSPSWGFYFYGEGRKIPDNFVICRGGKLKHIDLPWALDWVRTSRMIKDGSWLHERKGDRKRGIDIDWWSEETQAKLWKETHPYQYVLGDGRIQDRLATITVEEREWRPRWFRWTNIFAKIRTDIDIEFSGEVGEREGSWKGGTIGCSWDLLPGETPLGCLRRREKERVFR